MPEKEEQKFCHELHRGRCTDISNISQYMELPVVFLKV